MSRVLTDSLTYAYAKCENQIIIMFHQWPFFFQNKRFLFHKLKSIGRFPISTFISQVPCVYAFVGHRFQVYTVGRAFQTFFYGLSLPVIMSNLNTGSFTLRGGGGDLPQLAIPNTHIFHFQNLETQFGLCPTLLNPPSNTKHRVDLYHALTPMSCDVLVHNAMQSCYFSFIPCYIYDEC